MAQHNRALNYFILDSFILMVEFGSFVTTAVPSELLFFIELKKWPIAVFIPCCYLSMFINPKLLNYQC
jgi:hypothetical protein